MKLKSLVALSLVAVTVIAGCGGDSSDSTTTGTGTAAASGESETLNVGTITGILPYEGFAEDGETLIGFEPDILREAAKRMGMTAEFQVVEFDALLPALESGRYDTVAAGFLDTVERQEKFDFVDATRDRFGLAAPEDIASGLKTFDDLCGLKIGATATGAYRKPLEDQVEKCEAEGKPAMSVPLFDGDAQGFLALKSGQIDAFPGNVPLVVQYGKDNPGFAAAPLTFLPAPSGFPFVKGSPLTKRFQEALQSMMDDGTYDEILEKWDVSAIAVDEAQINAATS